MPRIIKGDVQYNGDHDYADVEEIKGTLDCEGADTTASFPKLTTIGGYLYCRGADTTASFPKLTTVGGTLYCEGADTKTSFPKLTSKGTGSGKAAKKVALAFHRRGFLLMDGILSFIKGTKEMPYGKIHKITVVGKLKVSYCLEVDGVYSHGATIKEARESLLYKISSRDKSAYEGWSLDKVITKRQAIESYRVITGACEAGVRHFVEGMGKIKVRYTVGEVIALTKGQYGNDEYREFFAGKQS